VTNLSLVFGCYKSARQVVAHYAYIIVAYYPAAAPSDNIFRVLCTNSLTYLLILDLFEGPQKFNFNTFGGGDYWGLTLGNSNTAVGWR